MRTTVTLDDELISKAAEFSGIADKSKLINYTLDEYIKKMAARRLAALGGTMPDFDIPGRGGMGSFGTNWSETSKVADSPQ
jgi:Arc/MetJ family transcription regulator